MTTVPVLKKHKRNKKRGSCSRFYFNLQTHFDILISQEFVQLQLISIDFLVLYWDFFAECLVRVQSNYLGVGPN